MPVKPHWPGNGRVRRWTHRVRSEQADHGHSDRPHQPQSESAATWVPLRHKSQHGRPKISARLNQYNPTSEIAAEAKRIPVGDSRCTNGPAIPGRRTGFLTPRGVKATPRSHPTDSGLRISPMRMASPGSPYRASRNWRASTADRRDSVPTRSRVETAGRFTIAAAHSYRAA